MRLPPYGRALQEQRDAGQHPDRVFVFYAGEKWPRPFRCTPQLMVPAADYAPGHYAWWVVAGLHVVLVAQAFPDSEHYRLWRSMQRARRELGRGDGALSQLNAIEADYHDAALHWPQQHDGFFHMAAEIGRQAAMLTLVLPVGAVHPVLPSWDPGDARSRLYYTAVDGGHALAGFVARSASSAANPWGWSDADYFAYCERAGRYRQEYGRPAALPGELRSLTGATFDVAA